MGYKNYSKMSKEERRLIYEKQKVYRATKKSLCLVIPKSAYAYINRYAKHLGWSFTKTLMYGASMYWYSMSSYELKQMREFPDDYDYIEVCD